MLGMLVFLQGCRKKQADYHGARPVELLTLVEGENGQESGFFVPMDAVGAVKLAEEEYEMFVWVVDPASWRLHAVNVVLVGISGQFMRVQGEGLEAGMTIVGKGARFLQEGTKVRPADLPPP